MMKSSGFIVLGLVAALCLGAAAFRDQESESVRFVDINEIVSNYEKAKRQQDDYQKSYMGQVGALQARDEELNKKKRELAPLDRNSEEFAKKGLEVEVEQLRLQREKESLLKERDKKRMQILLAAYEDIVAAVKKYAEANHLKSVLVVQKDSTKDSDTDMQEKSFLASRRQVLYYEPSLDATTQIIKILNSQ